MTAFYREPRFWVRVCVLVVALVILYQFWQWEVERVEVPAGKFLVRVHRWGKDLPEGEMLAPDESYKGVMPGYLPEGRHFLNPLFWGYEIHKIEDVPAKKCLVLMRKYGAEIPTERRAHGDILAQEGERGIVKDVLPPAAYRLNPYEYDWLTVDAVEVRVDQVGVRTLKAGLDPNQLPPDPTRGPYVVPEKYRGVQAAPVPPGTYYVNPFVETITPVEVRSHRVELSDIEFPSRDGFILKPHMLVEYAVEPEKAPELFVRLSEAGLLHQEDQSPEAQANNDILQKVILPHIRGSARIEGSNFDARDFIITQSATDAAAPKKLNPREVLQKAMLAKVKPACKELGIDIRAVTVSELVPPDELASQISERELALVEQERNKAQVQQFKAAQKLKAAEALKQQAREKVEAETRLIQAKTKAEQLLEVAESQQKTELENAQLKLEASRQQAAATVARGQADAAVTMLQNEAEVAGLKKAVQGFQSAQQFAQYHVLKRLGPALTEIFASDDSDFAKLIAGYLTAPPEGGVTKPVSPTLAKTPLATQPAAAKPASVANPKPGKS